MAKGIAAPGRWLSPRLATAVGATGAAAALSVAGCLLTGVITPAGASVQSARPNQCDVRIHLVVDARGNESVTTDGGCLGHSATRNQLTHMLGAAHLIVPVYTRHGNTCQDLDSRTCFEWDGRRISILWTRTGDTVTS